MSVLLLAVCDRCGAEHRPDRPVRSFQPGAVRTRAAFHGWRQHEEHGVVLDLCPGCLQEQVPSVEQVAERVLVRAASAASASPAQVVHPAVMDADAARCHWCLEGEHQWCAGCECGVCP